MDVEVEVVEAVVVVVSFQLVVMVVMEVGDTMLAMVVDTQVDTVVDTVAMVRMGATVVDMVKDSLLIEG